MPSRTSSPCTLVDLCLLAALDKCSHLNHLKQLEAFFATPDHRRTHFFLFKLLRFCVNSLSNLHYARYIFDQFPNPNVYLYTAMITAHSSSNDFSLSLELYRDMLCQGCPLQPNHFIFPHVLKCASYAKTLHTHVLKFGFGGYPIAQTALAVSYLKRGDCIRQLFDEISDKNVVTWTTMMYGWLNYTVSTYFEFSQVILTIFSSS